VAGNVNCEKNSQPQFVYPNQDVHPNWAYTLFCGAYAFGHPIRTIGEQAPQ